LFSGIDTPAALTISTRASRQSTPVSPISSAPNSSAPISPAKPP
jgi:hypothetical protein